MPVRGIVCALNLHPQPLPSRAGRQVLFSWEVELTQPKLEDLLLWVVAVLLMMAPWALL
jgi:hypothetical protein